MLKPDTRSDAQKLADYRAKRARYAREWRNRHPERAAEIQQAYWRRKLAQADAQQDRQKDGD